MFKSIKYKLNSIKNLDAKTQQKLIIRISLVVFIIVVIIWLLIKWLVKW